MTINLADVGSGYKRSAINSNFTAIEDEINNNLLSKNGGVGLEADLDANSRRVINLADGVNNKDAITVQQLNGAIAAAGSGLIAMQKETQKGSDAVSRVFTASGVSWDSSGSNLIVTQNGTMLYQGRDYTIPAANQIEVVATHPLNINDDWDFRTNVATTNSTTNTSAISHTQFGTSYNLATYLQNRHEVYVSDYSELVSGGDWSTAVQAAVNAANGADVILPAGVLRFDSTISINTSGEGDTSAPRIRGKGMYHTVIDNQTGGEAFHVESGTAAEFAYGFTIERLRITCLTPSTGTVGVRVDGCRFVQLEHVFIDSQSSHGVYGLSSIGDFTDTSSLQLKHCQIESNGGYGIYARCTGGAIQYNWNADQCRIGSNTLGGVLLESGTNLEFTNCGIYYNSNFGVRVVTPSGGVAPKLVDIYKCEFDTNDGVQVDIVNGNTVNIYEPYLIANAGLSTAFTKGVVVGAAVNDCTITSSYPRLNGSLTGLTVHEFELGCSGVVVRDTSYQGYSVSNGDMYVINEPSVVIDDSQNRDEFKTGTYTVEVKNSGETVTSPTTTTGHYSVNGNVVTVGFRNLNNIDVSGFAGGDIVVVTLPFSAKTNASSGYIGDCIITNDSGSGVPSPTVDNGSSNAAFSRSGSNAFLTASELTSSTSDISRFTITYIKD